ncbi:hypothetical protein Tco_0668291 [Tanacetum coccineum]
MSEWDVAGLQHLYGKITAKIANIAHEMWIAIERLQHGESLNIQDVKTNLFWEFGKFTSRDGGSIESYYSRFYKMMNEMIRNNLTVATMQYQKEVNEICAERIAKNANPLALVAAASPYPDPYYQAPKSNKPYAPTSKQSSSTRSNASTKFKGKEIAKPITPSKLQCMDNMLLLYDLSWHVDCDIGVIVYSRRQDLGFIPSDNVVLSSTYVGKILGADQLLVILCYRYQESGIGYWILSMTISGSGFGVSSWHGSRVDGRSYLLSGAIDGSEANRIISDSKIRNGHVEVYGYAFWVNQCTSGFHGVNEPGGVRVTREDDRGVTEGREDVREVFQQRGSRAKRKLSRCGRNQMGNEPILALPEGADNFVVYYDARSKDLEACLEKGRSEFDFEAKYHLGKVNVDVVPWSRKKE